MVANNNKSPQHITAYRKILDNVLDKLEEFEDVTWPKIERAIDEAKQTTMALSELTHDEADNIAHYVGRDIKAAGNFIAEAGRTIKNWTIFDWTLAEERTWQRFLEVADRTNLELVEFQHELETTPYYHAGEILGIGNLQCTKCQYVMQFKCISVIPPCAECKNKSFVRNISMKD